PIKNRLQIWADRWFYGERYTLRMGLQDFGRMLARTTALPSLLDSVVVRLSQMLSVRRVAIFIEDVAEPSGFRLARALGIEGEINLPQDIKVLVRARSAGRGFISAEDLEASAHAANDNGSVAPNSESRSSLQKNRLYYYVPCVVRDRIVAIICVGRTTSGALLSSEDTELLRGLSGYVAVAIDNSLLYRSEMEKAGELARLKEFSENIIESVSVGIAVIDLDGRITTWNSAMESMFLVGRRSAFGLE